MTQPYRRVTGGGFAGAKSRRLTRRSARRRVRPAWIAAGAAVALVCALGIWLTMQLRGSGGDVHSAEVRLPRNIVDMHGTYIGNAHARPWLGC